MLLHSQSPDLHEEHHHPRSSDLLHLEHHAPVAAQPDDSGNAGVAVDHDDGRNTTPGVQTSTWNITFGAQTSSTRNIITPGVQTSSTWNITPVLLGSQMTRMMLA